MMDEHKFQPAGLGGISLAALPLLASDYQFCRVDARTEDYLLSCAVLVFIAIRYLYPSRTIEFRRLTLVLTGLWLLSYTLILLQMPNPQPFLTYFSLFYMFYYVVLSLYLNYLRLQSRT